MKIDWETTRSVAGVRGIRTALRTAHIIAFAALFGGHVFGVPAERLVAALWATLGTGTSLVALEIYHTPVWAVQLRGLATFLKCLLVALVAVWWDSRVVLLAATIVIGSVSSHMPGRFRYYSVLHGRQVGDKESG